MFLYSGEKPAEDPVPLPGAGRSNTTPATDLCPARVPVTGHEASYSSRIGNPYPCLGNWISLCKDTRSTRMGQKDSKKITHLFCPDNVGQNWKLPLTDHDLKEILVIMTVPREKCLLPSAACNIETNVNSENLCISVASQACLFNFQIINKDLSHFSQKRTPFIRFRNPS